MVISFNKQNNQVFSAKLMCSFHVPGLQKEGKVIPALLGISGLPWTPIITCPLS